MNIADRVAALAGNGCVVKVFYGEAFGTEIHKLLKAAGVKRDVAAQGRQDPPEAADRARGVRRERQRRVRVDRLAQLEPVGAEARRRILRSSNRGVVDSYTRHFAYMFDHA